jgi:hypothetical protein
MSEWYTLPLLILLFIVGVVVGMMVNVPTYYKVDFRLTPDFYKTINTTFANWTNICCYPKDCQQASNNPKICTCMYLVYCNYLYFNDSFNFSNITLVFKK